MGLFKKRTNDDPEEIARLSAQIASMSARLQASEQAKGDLDSTVQGIVARLETPTPPPPTPAPPATPAVQAADIDKLNAKLDRLAARIDDDAAPDTGLDAATVERLEAMVQRLSDRIDELDGRIVAISTELANQITELSGDIDSLGGNAPPTDEIVDELRDAQTRLAGEQARYQIAFRQDLADLADRLRRS